MGTTATGPPAGKASPGSSPATTAAAFDMIMGSADPAMVIVTAANKIARGGCLVGFHAQAGIDPLRYSVWVSQANMTHEVIQASDWVGIHFLRDDDLDLAELFGRFSQADVDKFEQCELVASRPGIDPPELPLLQRCPNRIVARKLSVNEVSSDHACVVCEPVRVDGDGPFRPLRLSQVGHIDAGHDPDDIPPEDCCRAA